MLDFGMIIRNGLWILGLAVLLAVWSYARYSAIRQGVRTRQMMSEFRYAFPADIGLLLFVAGMALTEPRSWARILWLILGSAIIIHMVMSIAIRRHTDAKEQEDPRG